MEQRGPPKGCYLFSRTCSLASPSKKESELVPGDEESIKKGKRLKTPIKKSASKPATGIVIREPPVETKSKRKEKLKGGFSSWKRNRAAVKTLTSNNEQESSDESSKQENESEEQESDLKQDEESDDDDQEEEEFNQENESEDDKMKSDKEQGMNDTTDQFDDDADARLEKPTKTAIGIVQVFRFNDRIIALEKEVSDLKKDLLHTQVTSLVDSHLDTRLGETREEFMNFLSDSLTARIKEQVKDQLPQILPQEVSNFAPPVIEKLIKESRDEVTLAKVSSQPQSTYEDASTLTEFELKKILLDKMEKNSDMPQDQAGNLGDNEDEPRDETASRHDWFKKPTPPQEPTDPDWNVGKTTKEECYKALLEKLDWENPEGGDYPFDLSKPLPLITHGKRQRVTIPNSSSNNDLKLGISKEENLDL
ncbi:hypothetical protein Tco_1499898 [Tanacetum coccineum]